MSYQVRSGTGCFKSAIALMGFLTWAALFSAAQANGANGRSPGAITSAPDLTRTTREIVREIDDPATGDRWLLERDAQHGAGPGRMVLLQQEMARPAPAGNFVGLTSSGSDTGASSPLFRAGDHLIVEEHTRVLDAVFEAIALSPAREGETFRVRLSAGRRVVKAVAVAPGRAMLSLDSGVQP